METGSIAERFRERSILITGSTGFPAKMLVEKILRIQPDVRKLYLLVRAPDAAAAEERLLTEVVGKGLFDVLREQHGASFHSFIKEKVCPLPGDITHQNFGLGNSEILQLSQDVDIIVDGAATTNFMERYDVALATNTAVVIHLCQFAKQCDNLKMLLHVSTAYVAGEKAGLLLEKPFQIGARHYDKGHTLWLAKYICADESYGRDVTSTIGTRPSIPGDMVINAMMAAINSHWKKQAQVIYHVTSAHQNPLPLSLIVESMYKYFHINPRTNKDGKIIKNKRVLMFKRFAYFQAYMTLRYKVPLEMMHAANVLFGGIYSKNYKKLNRGYNILMTGKGVRPICLLQRMVRASF
uniref:Fatty acyl-CoA reductase n=1 Tax=Oryza glumipatula TaxID=40148 RepID=A0A0D9ZJF5_9ORYZ